MQGPRSNWVYCIESTEQRLRLSRDSSNRSQHCVGVSKDLVLQSRTLLARYEPLLGETVAHKPVVQSKSVPAISNGKAALASSQTELVEGLQVVSSQTIRGEVVLMDGKHFVDCDLIQCTLQYSGQAVILESTRFEECSFQFSGEAALTMRFLECFELLPRPIVSYAVSSRTSGSMRPN